MKIWAHTLVRNEERFVWFAVNSIISYVDKVMLWDTGSTDKTVLIIKELKKIHGDKVELNLLNSVNPEEFTQVRQEMLKNTHADWIMILDGDEVWWKDSIYETTNFIRTSDDSLESVVNPNINVIGDIYHYQEERAGGYSIDNLRGHINIRLFKNIPGMQFKKPHGQQGIYDKEGVLIQNRSSTYRKFINKPYMHFTNIMRSFGNDSSVPKRDQKLKYELGIPFPSDFFYPEVFFDKFPEFVPSPWVKRDKKFVYKGLIHTPFRYTRRRFLPQKVGY